MSQALLVLGALCVAYGLLCAVLYPAGLFFVVWLAVGALLLLAGWAHASGRWERLRLGARRAICGVVAAALLTMGVTSGLVVTSAVTAVPEGLDYLIVLGAGLNPDGTPKESLRLRLDAAASYLGQNPGTVCIVSGGRGADEPVSEAESMRRYLVAAGVDEGRLVVEDQATTTAENLSYSLALMESPDASVGIVSNDFHLFRAQLMARKLGMTEVYGVPAPSNPLFLPQAVLRECFALFKAWIMGTI